MTKSRVSVIVIGLVLLIGSRTQAAVIHFVDDVYQNLTESNTKHPRKAWRSIIIMDDTDGAVEVCIGYVNNFQKRDKGRIVGEVKISRGAETETLSISGNVRRNSFGACRSIAGLSVGDTVSFHVKFKGFSRHKPGTVANWAGAVAVGGGNPFLRTACDA